MWDGVLLIWLAVCDTSILVSHTAWGWFALLRFTPAAEESESGRDPPAETLTGYCWAVTHALPASCTEMAASMNSHAAAAPQTGSRKLYSCTDPYSYIAHYR